MDGATAPTTLSIKDNVKKTNSAKKVKAKKNKSPNKRTSKQVDKIKENGVR